MTADSLQLTHVPVVEAAMLIHRPPAEVFRAFADPAVTTRFWCTKSTGPMTPGAHLRWDWEMYGMSTGVTVREIEPDRRILFDWGDDSPTTVEMRFTPWAGGATFAEITESGLSGSGDELVARAAGSTAGFTIVLCAAKALLEHDIVLTAVRDRHPRNLVP
jgi:uncharacterized protein YndB with AHSA1/START domain